MKPHEVLAKHFDNILLAGNVPHPFRDVIFTLIKNQNNSQVEKILEESIGELTSQVTVMKDVLKQIRQADKRIWIK